MTEKIILTLDIDVLNALFHEAHERDVTLNQLINEILKREMMKESAKEVEIE